MTHPPTDTVYHAIREAYADLYDRITGMTSDLEKRYDEDIMRLSRMIDEIKIQQSMLDLDTGSHT